MRYSAHFLSDEWLSLWPDSTQFVLDRDFSDHCPILLRSTTVDWGPRPFKVMDWWLKDKDFQKMVSHRWGNYHPSGWGGYALKLKLKFIKGCIRQWSLQNGVINVNLRRRHVELPSYNCPLCDEEEETAGHILYSCIKTRTLWWETMSWVNRWQNLSTNTLFQYIAQLGHMNCPRMCEDRAVILCDSFCSWGLADSTFVILNLHLELEINCEKTRSLWWETMRWVNRVGSYSIDPKNHFLQFTQWNSKDSTNKRWEFMWLALSFSIWYHRNAKIFKNQPFTPEKVMDDALFHTWSWIKCVEKDFQMHFNFWSTNLKDVLS
ncbi:hypothetical protein GmHk_10G028106 [Glycine max]|nr:hypothetical protein GmHk_10G028106 [Glycine max]